MAVIPDLTCPRCRRAADYQTTVDILEPPVGKIDIGHCPACACLFEYIRETGMSYDSTTWLPLCRACKQPVAVTAIEGAGAEITAVYECREHAAERWQYSRRGERWVRA